MVYAPCASRRRGHIFFKRWPPTIRPCAPCLHLQNAGNCIFLHKNLRKYFFCVITIYINLQVQSDLSAQILINKFSPNDSR